MIAISTLNLIHSNIVFGQIPLDIHTKINVYIFKILLANPVKAGAALHKPLSISHSVAGGLPK